MIFSETHLTGSYLIEIEKIEDGRGFFTRTFDKNEFIKMELDSEFVQSSISQNKKKGTIRGMHYQTKPYEENKIVRCVKGKIFDVIIDLRLNSKTFKEWLSVELSEDNYKMLYIPKGFAHGFQTLENNTEVYYEITEVYNKKSSRGIKWNDPTFNINWPLDISIISEKDKNFSFFNNAYQE
jgi:dTDP-4-dehydrorhamnose 3,5-epimerase